jgi:hypothetical protein
MSSGPDTTTDVVNQRATAISVSLSQLSHSKVRLSVVGPI